MILGQLRIRARQAKNAALVVQQPDIVKTLFYLSVRKQRNAYYKRTVTLIVTPPLVIYLFRNKMHCNFFTLVSCVQFHISAVLLRRTCCFELAGAAELCNAVVVWCPHHRRQIRPHLNSDSICLSPIPERRENSHLLCIFCEEVHKKFKIRCRPLNHQNQKYFMGKIETYYLYLMSQIWSSSSSIFLVLRKVSWS